MSNEIYAGSKLRETFLENFYELFLTYCGHQVFFIYLASSATCWL